MKLYSPTGTEKPSIEKATDNPELGEMVRELDHAINNAFEFYDRNEHCLNTRYCWWPGQTRDGRKWGTLEREPFPWPGASDTRIRTVDMVIQEQSELLLTTLGKMNIQTAPTQAMDADWGARISTLLRWYMYNAMADEGDSEIGPLANYMLTYGSTVLSVHWLQTLAYERKTVKLDDLLAAGMQAGGPQMLAQLQKMLFDPGQQDTVVSYVKQISSMLTGAEATKVINDLRTNGVAQFPKPYISEARPSLRALQTFQDVFFPVNTWRLQKARFIAERELLTATELQEKAQGREQWDSDWVDQVIESQRGKTFNGNLHALNVLERQRELGGVWGEWMNEAEDLYEVWHFYHRASNKGIPAIFRTVMHPFVGDSYGLHEIMPYLHGQYPYIEFVREKTCRSILASRGLPEVLDTHQSEIKVQRDARTDRASVTTHPPMLVKHRPGQKKNTYGPGVEIPVNKMDDIAPLSFGAPDETSIEVEQACKRDLNEYVGRAGEGVDPQLVLNRQQAQVTLWLNRWRLAGKQVLQLAQQYTPPMTIPRIVGMTPKPIDVSRESIAGQFDLILTFDARFANQEYVLKLMSEFAQYLFPIDTNAVVNRDAVIRYVMASIDPTLADLAVRDTESAQATEVDDEQTNLAKMFAGVPPPMKLQGQNFAARLQVLQQAIQGNPRLQQALQQWPDFGAMVDQRVKFLTQQVTQQKNRMIGVYGTMPTPGSAGAPALGAPTGMGGAQ